MQYVTCMILRFHVTQEEGCELARSLIPASKTHPGRLALQETKETCKTLLHGRVMQQRPRHQRASQISHYVRREYAQFFLCRNRGCFRTAMESETTIVHVAFPLESVARKQFLTHAHSSIIMTCAFGNNNSGFPARNSMQEFRQTALITPKLHLVLFRCETSSSSTPLTITFQPTSKHLEQLLFQNHVRAILTW